LNEARTSRQGFTLIELLIVVAIIAVLVAVLAIAIFPWLAKNNENSTRTLMTSVSGLLEPRKNALTVDQLRRDAGPLSSQVSGDPRIASAQLIVFYFAPSKTAWDASNLGRNREYRPEVDPKEWAKFLMSDGAPDMPYLTDAWGTAFWYSYDKVMDTYILRSAGKDMQWDTEDDLVATKGTKGVQFWSEIRK